MRNLVSFHPTTRIFANFTSMSYFCPKYMKFELKKCRGVIFHDTKQWCKIWINPDLLVSKMAWLIRWTSIRELKVWKLYNDGLFLSKAYNVSARKFERNYVSWHWSWRVMQVWRKTDMRNFVNFNPRVESLKICTLIGSFCPKHIKI